MLSHCFFGFSVDVGIFVRGLSQISSFFSLVVLSSSTSDKIHLCVYTIGFASVVQRKTRCARFML